MTALAASDWGVSVTDRRIENKLRVNRVKLTLNTDGGFYPSGTVGIALPTTASTWGMVRNIDYICIYDNDALNGILWKYLVTSHQIAGFWSENPTAAGGPTHFSMLPTTWSPSDSPSQPTIYVEAKGW
jgi:hypothetical protein